MRNHHAPCSRHSVWLLALVLSCAGGPLWAQGSPPDQIFADGFESGSFGAWSWAVGLDTQPPEITFTSPAAGASSFAAEIEVSGQVRDNGGVARVTLDGREAELRGSRGEETFTGRVSLEPGENAVRAQAFDRAGNSSSASLAVTRLPDDVAPTIAVTKPSPGFFLAENRPSIEVSFADGESGVDTGSLAFTVNGAALDAACATTETGAECTPAAALPEGTVALAATVRDLARNEATARVDLVVDTTGVEIALTSPADGDVTKDAELDVAGTVGPGVESVDVNGVAATLAESGFSATVPLREGVNMVVALGRKASGNTGTASIEVTRDIVAPIVKINSPRDGFVSIERTVAITGLVNDIVDAGADARVLVNGREAPVENGSFLFLDFELVPGPNTVEAVATDRVGNVGRDAITVDFRPPVGARLGVAAGNGQVGGVNEALPEPLVVRVTDDLGNPVAGRSVTFDVTRNSGVLRSAAGAEPRRGVQVTTNGAGEAAVFFALGDTSGEGNNRVTARGLGVAGEVEFCATGLAVEPDKILMVNGDNQRGLVAHPLATPLAALVVDGDGNPIEGLDVTFEVIGGGGSFDGEPMAVKRSNVDGVARAVLTLGTEPGINNNVARASYEGLVGLPATFTSSGLPAGDEADTRLAGVVLDNGQTPIPGARVTIGDTDLEALTDDEGQFLVEGVPVGHVELHIDPTGSPRPETFPPLAFETVTVAGQRNTIGQPILIPALDMDNSKIVGGDEDVAITMSGVAGLSLKVFANSVTFPDGSKTGRLTISQVHLDKVPMTPPSGTIFMPPSWTIQPAGVLFDPPAPITIPNDGLPPGRVIDIFQFDHTLNQFINVGKGTVSDDGFSISSDPGFGILRSGWGGCGQPQPPTTCVARCPVCHRCINNECVADTDLDQDCCDRAKDYEGFRKGLGTDSSRKLFSEALVCVADDICKSLDRETGRDFADPDWMLCVNKELYERWKAHDSKCWKAAEIACDLASKLGSGRAQEVACFGAQATCHDGVDMAASLKKCGCGTNGDWDKVGDLVGSCSRDFFDKTVDVLSRFRKRVTGCK